MDVMLMFSFTNNSNVPIEVMVFKLCFDEITIDVKAGLVTRHKTQELKNYNIIILS
jgi:hypothetical protein